MDNESLNWFRLAKCLTDVGNKVLRRNLNLHASTYSLSSYNYLWQRNVKDHCQSDDLKVLWTKLYNLSLALDGPSHLICLRLLSKWKSSVGNRPMEIVKQLSILERWQIDLQNTISKNSAQQNTLSKLSSPVQTLLMDHSILLTAVRNWTKDFIHLCHMNQLDLLYLIEQHNERTSSLMSTFLRQLDIMYIGHGSEGLKNALQKYQQDEGSYSGEFKTNTQTSFISWQSKIDTLINSWAAYIKNCPNLTILQNLLTYMRNNLPAVHKTCQVNVNNICSTRHMNLQKELAELNHQLQQVGESALDIQNFIWKWHEKLNAFLSVSDLQTKEFFDSKKTVLQSLNERDIITEPQWSLIFPSQGSTNLQAFDITLSTTLLGNICPVFPPELGWSGEILDADHSFGADLIRLKTYRNNLVGHIPHLSLRDSDFEKIWGILQTILQRLSMPIGNKFWQEVQEQITELRTCSFDIVQEMKLKLKLLNWYKSESGQIQESLENIRQELEEKLVFISSDLQHMKTQVGNISEGILIPRFQGLEEKSENIKICLTETVIPRLQGLEEESENIQKCLTEGTIEQLERIEQRVTARIEEYMSNQRVNRTKQNQRIELTKGTIRSHREVKKDVHVRTRAYEQAKTILVTHRHVTLRGKPGDGKTHTALTLIADLMETKPEMQPVKVNKAKEWEKLVDMKQPLIVFMDEVLGKYGVSETDLIEWEHLSELIHPNIGDSSVFLIVSLRNQIALKIQRSLHRSEDLSWMFDSNVINISDENYCLTKEEKREMLMKYARKHLKQTDNFAIDHVVNLKNVIGFPQNCKLWSCRQNLALKEVFANDMCLVEEIKYIASNSCQDYLFLVILMLSGGVLSFRNNTEELREKTKKIAKLCGVREELNIRQCKDIGHSLCNTFVEYDKETNTFRFQHDSIESAIFFSFGNDYPEITLELCSLQALTKSCCLRNESNIAYDESFLNFKIIIEDSAYFKIFMERFNKSLESRKQELFQCIAEALVWQSSRFSDYFLSSLTSSVDVLNFLSKKDFDEQSLLAYFMYAGNTTIAMRIVKKISQFNIRDHGLVSRQILFTTVNACLADKADFLNYLVRYQGKVDDFVMFAAASTGNVSIMDKLLLDGGNSNAMISVSLGKNLKHTIKNCVLYPKNASYHHDINLLHIAAAYGRIDMVIYLGNKCSELLHKTSSFGFTAIHFVACSENVPEGLVFPTPVNANMVTCAQENVAHISIKDENIGVLKELMVKGLDIKARTKKGWNTLHIAAENNNLAMVNYLIKECPQLVRETNIETLTPLHSAAQGGDVQVIETLIKAGSDIMAKNKEGNNILHLAALSNNLSAMKYLIKTYPQLKLDTTNDGLNVLHCCCSGGDISTMELMVQEGFDIKTRTKEGLNALHIAATNKNLAIVNYLIKECPLLLQETNINMFTPLHSAARGGDVQVIETLIKAGSDVMARTKEGNNILHSAVVCNNLSAMEYMIKTYPQLKLDITNAGWTVLHCCCLGGDVSAMKLLVQEGFDIKARTKEGWNALHIAATNKKLEIVNYLIKECPQLLQETNINMFTPLHSAAREGDVQVIESLIKAGSDITARTKEGYNILHSAALGNNLSAMEYLIETYPQLKLDVTNTGWTVLHCCSKGGDISAMELLVQEGFDIKARTNQGWNALHIAAGNEKLAMVNYLIKECPQLLQETNINMFTPLHICCCPRIRTSDRNLDICRVRY